jgi:hypothetical protein
MSDIPEAIRTLQRIVKKFPDFTAGVNKLQEYEKSAPPKKAAPPAA